MSIAHLTACPHVYSFLFLFYISFNYHVYAQEHSEAEINAMHASELEMANFFCTKAGAKVIGSSASMKGTSFSVENVISDTLGLEGKWRVQHKNKFPHWFVVELPQPTYLTTFVFNTKHLNESKYKGISARAIKIEVSEKSPRDGYHKVAHIFLKKGQTEQIFNVEGSTARWVKISILNNWNHPQLTELGRVYAYNDVAFSHFESQLISEGIVDISDIKFGTDSTQVTAENIPIIETLIEVFKVNHSWKLIIEGHTDALGNESYNQNLSEQRAKSVVDFMITHGVEAERLTYTGMGSAQPIVKDESGEALAQNRRVTFRIIKE